MKDDDEEEDNTFGVTRYPCMPSLVALQQMRNRLHLAFLGRKLMKWTMLATGRELRRLAGELDALYKGFSDDLGNAFMLLARCRYFYPNLNQMVVEDVPKKAGVVVIPSTKAVSGVKIVLHHIQETDAKPYVHLGIEKGGQTIMETKQAWLELLKRLITMMSLRSNFLMVELSNKAATKRMNVLKKIVIPRTNVTVGYILSELEEMAREEFHRLKKVKEKKGGKAAKSKHTHDANDGLCPVCIEKNEQTGKNEKKAEVVKPVEIKPTPTLKEILKEPDISETSLRSVPTTRSLRVEEGSDSIKLEYLKKHINELIVLGKSFIQSGMEHIHIEEFLTICESVKVKIEQVFEGDDESPQQYTGNIEKGVEHFKGHLRNVIKISNEIKDEIALEPNIECFIHACEELDNQLNPTRETTSKASERSRLEELESQIDDVVKITTKYKNQGLLTTSVEAFLKSCNIIKSKILENSQQEAKTDKLNHLKEHINNLDMLTDEVKKGGLEIEEIEQFSKYCKQFKDKLDNYKKSERKELALSNLLEQIDQTIDLSIKAKDVGLVGGSIEDFVKSSEKLKKQITPGEDTKTNVLRHLKSNIEGIMRIINKYKNEGFVTDSVEDFITSCEITKNKIERYEIFPAKPNKTQTWEPSCSGHCMVCNEPFVIDVSPLNEETSDVCKSCHKKMHKEHSQKSVVPCVSCQDEIQEFKLPSEISLCQTCSNLNEELLDVPGTENYLQSKLPQEDYCDICKKKIVEGSHAHSEAESDLVDSSLGYYEKKVRKITKVTRIQNTDGTIREEKKTISIRKVRRDPTQISLDDDDDYNDTSSDSYNNDEKQVALCTVCQQNQRGFIASRVIQSEIGIRVSPIVIAGLRSCISVGSFCFDGEYLNSQLTFSNEFNTEL